MPDKTNLEKYLAGEPLTDELAQLREGDFARQFDFPAQLFPAPAAQNKALTRADRELLKEAKASGVLAIIEQTLKKAIRSHIESATIDSENDPLGRAGDISRQWAYVTMYRRAVLEFAQLIDAEIAELDRDAGILGRHQAERAAG